LESGAGARALQDLSAPRSRPGNAKRRGVRNASSALAVNQALSPNLRNFVSRLRRDFGHNCGCGSGRLAVILTGTTR